MPIFVQDSKCVAHLPTVSLHGLAQPGVEVVEVGGNPDAEVRGVIGRHVLEGQGGIHGPVDAGKVKVLAK